MTDPSALLLAHAYPVLLGATLALSATAAMLCLLQRLGDAAFRLTAVALAASAAAYAVAIGQWLGWVPPSVADALRVLAGCGVVWLWSLVRMLFDRAHAGRRAWATSSGLIIAAVLLPRAAALAWPALRPMAAGALSLLAAVLTVHALWMLIAGRSDDLDTARRRARVLLAGGGSAYVLLVLVAVFTGWRARHPEAFVTAVLIAQVLLKMAWLWLTAGQASPVMRLFATTHEAPPSPAQPWPAEAPPAVPSPAVATSATASAAPSTEATQARRLQVLMEQDRLYRQHRLGLAELAARLGSPEHRVRALINGTLGFRNYSAFLNHFRLREVAARLRDPADAHLPILTLALDAGFASIGPFNRAFRDAFGCTPSDYRRAATDHNIMPAAGAAASPPPARP